MTINFVVLKLLEDNHVRSSKKLFLKTACCLLGGGYVTSLAYNRQMLCLGLAGEENVLCYLSR